MTRFIRVIVYNKQEPSRRSKAMSEAQCLIHLKHFLSTTTAPRHAVYQEYKGTSLRHTLIGEECITIERVRSSPSYEAP